MTEPGWKNWRDLGPRDALRELEGYLRRIIGGHDPSWYESGWTPEVDLSESDDAYILEADLPGVAKESVELLVAGNVVILRGERACAPGRDPGTYCLRERRQGRFERSFEIPGSFEEDRVAAAFEHGVMRVTLPKSPGTAPRSIRIDVD